MSKLAPLQRFARELAKCSTCGLCLPVCPSYAIAKTEPHGPRGRVLLVRALLARRIEPGQTVQAFASCALCGKCQRVCPARLPLLPIFFVMRRVLRGLLPIDFPLRFLPHLLAANPKVLDFVQSPIALLQGAIKKPASFPRLAVQPFAPSVAQAGKDRVLLFAGCLVRRFFPAIASKTIAVLQRQGIEVQILAELGCCGRPLAAQGANFGKVVKANLAVLANLAFDALLTPCPGCLDAIRNLWPQLADLNVKEKDLAHKLAAKALDVNVYLSRVLPATPLSESGQNARWWHSPCLLQADSKNAIRQFLGLRMLPAETGASCCGAALHCLGQLKQPELTQAKDRRALPRLTIKRKQTPAETLAKDIWQQALAAHARAIITACPGCILTLKKSLAQARKPLPVYHVLEVVVKNNSQDS